MPAEGGDCHVTLSSNSTSQLDCSDNDELTVSEGVTLSRTGTVALDGQSNENLKITNEFSFDHNFSEINYNDFEANLILGNTDFNLKYLEETITLEAKIILDLI